MPGVPQGSTGHRAAQNVGGPRPGPRTSAHLSYKRDVRTVVSTPASACLRTNTPAAAGARTPRTPRTPAHGHPYRTVQRAYRGHPPPLRLPRGRGAHRALRAAAGLARGADVGKCPRSRRWRAPAGARAALPPGSRTRARTGRWLLAASRRGAARPPPRSSRPPAAPAVFGGEHAGGWFPRAMSLRCVAPTHGRANTRALHTARRGIGVSCGVARGRLRASTALWTAIPFSNGPHVRGRPFPLRFPSLASSPRTRCFPCRPRRGAWPDACGWLRCWERAWSCANRLRARWRPRLSGCAAATTTTVEATGELGPLRAPARAIGRSQRMLPRFRHRGLSAWRAC